MKGEKTLFFVEPTKILHFSAIEFFSAAPLVKSGKTQEELKKIMSVLYSGFGTRHSSPTWTKETKKDLYANLIHVVSSDQLATNSFVSCVKRKTRRVVHACSQILHFFFNIFVGLGNQKRDRGWGGFTTCSEHKTCASFLKRRIFYFYVKILEKFDIFLI